tara:strand:- start:654 stop:1427 length:774 start_codon:yes stop_codon:yes gene_type:complete
MPDDIEEINNVPDESVELVDVKTRAQISQINGYTMPELATSNDIDTEYTFQDQTTQETAGQDWSPGGSCAQWKNGTDAVDGTYWEQPEDTNDVVKGWNCGYGSTGSPGTGPNGGVDTSDGTHESAQRYIYTETSSNNSLKCFVTRMPGSNFSTEMGDTGNDLNLKFWVHAYSSTSQMSNLYVYIDTNTTSKHGTATLLQSYTSFSGFTTNSSVWQQQTISLNSYRAVNSIHYIYFVSQGGAGFRADLSIDSVIIEEG